MKFIIIIIFYWTFSESVTLISVSHINYTLLEKLYRNTILKKLNFRILVQGGCSPVGCVLIQLLSNWKASVTTTCDKRAVPVAKALGASEILVLTETFDSSYNTNSVNEKNSFRNDLIDQLKLKCHFFDLIVITNKNSIPEKDLIKFLNDNGRVLSALPSVLVSDSCGFITRFFLKWYISTRFFLQVSNIYSFSCF